MLELYWWRAFYLQACAACLIQKGFEPCPFPGNNIYDTFPTGIWPDTAFQIISLWSMYSSWELAVNKWTDLTARDFSVGSDAGGCCTIRWWTKTYIAKLLCNIVLFIWHINFTSWTVNELYPFPANLLTLTVPNRSVCSDSIEILHQRFVSFCRSNVQRGLALALQAEGMIFLISVITNIGTINIIKVYITTLFVQSTLLHVSTFLMPSSDSLQPMPG
jgi:hypothetical protein